MKIPIILSILALTTVVFPGVAQEPSKIAVVDLTKVFAEHPETAVATKELTAARDGIRTVWIEKTNSLKEALQRHQEAIRAENKDSAAEILKEVNELEKAVATLKTTQERDLEQNFIEKKTAILKSIQKSVSEFNAEAKYAVILDDSATSQNGLPMVLDSSGATDITDEIIVKVKADFAK